MRESRACGRRRPRGRRSCLLVSRALKTRYTNRRLTSKNSRFSGSLRGNGGADEPGGGPRRTRPLPGRAPRSRAPPPALLGRRRLVPGRCPGDAGCCASASGGFGHAGRVGRCRASRGAWTLAPGAARRARRDPRGAGRRERERAAGARGGGRRLSPGRRELPPRCGPERTRPRGVPTRVCRPRPCRAEAPSRPGSPGPA